MTRPCLIGLFLLCATVGYADLGSPRNLISPPAAQTDSTITLIWDKPTEYASVTGYDIYQDGNEIGDSTRCNFQAGNLQPARAYTFIVRAKSGKAISLPSNSVRVSTRAKGATFFVTDFGAVSDGKTDNTRAIQAALDACTPGGTVLLPAGTFITGALFVRKSDTTVFLSGGALLQGTHDLAAYPMIKSRYEGIERETYASIINCGSMSAGVTNIAIRGPGTIDCQGDYLSPAQTKAANRSMRSHGLLLINCTNVYLEGFTIQNSPTWCIHPIYCQGLTTEGLTIHTDGYGVSNADGWDPDSSMDCFIFNSIFSTHDDCIAIKSGADADGRRVGRPSVNIRVTDCLFKSGGGFAVGSEMSGSVSNVVVQDCHFVKVDRGFNIKTRRKRGGIVENLVIKDVTAEHFGSWGFNLEMYYYDNRNTPPQPPEGTPVFRNFRFENITIDHVSGPAVKMCGLPESRPSNITFQNVTIKEAKTGCIVTNCNHVSFIDFKAHPKTGPLWSKLAENTDGISISPRHIEKLRVGTGEPRNGNTAPD
jgi:polygalacturonase